MKATGGDGGGGGWPSRIELINPRVTFPPPPRWQLLRGAARGGLLLTCFALTWFAGYSAASYGGWQAFFASALLLAVAAAMLVARRALNPSTGTTTEAVQGLLELVRDMEARP